ncbi:hypothetical protein NLU13_2613 [Sarocladium strictum]|uniref:Uncharacterized protein n=1 Tax=Sarocladium strictum TaxID=5046 RepID=A0AA39GN57_SARSR|nr:hypothetical protein NLU13_2613 [Sarocladium strictum]
MRRSSSSIALRQRLTATQPRTSLLPLLVAPRVAAATSIIKFNISTQHIRPGSTTVTSQHSASTMSSNNTNPTFKVVNYELLDELRRFWFEHIDDETRVILPDMPAIKRFFVGGEDFDNACTKKFSPALEELKAQGINSSEAILTALPPREPLDWLALLLLLDQIPRNCYRGDAAVQVFTYFDPLARGIAFKALELEIFTKSPVLRWNFGYRFWLALPLIHSESVAVHDRIGPEIFDPYEGDVESLLANSGDRDDGSEERKRAAAVVQERPDEAKFLLTSQVDSEEKHVAILRQFGRYPHRNGPLGREMTAEEQKYLDEGGDTFAPPKTDEEKA